MSRVIEISSYVDHDNLLDNNKQCVIFFGSKNCHHCRDMISFFEDLAENYPSVKFGHIEVTKVNVENVNGVPVFVVYKNTQPVEIVLGANKDKLLSSVKKLLV